jgi:hypothetical protein
MARHDFESFKKPLDEPFRDLDLEHCDYCKTWIGLDLVECGSCGRRRSDEDKNLARQVRVWRESLAGQEAYQKDEKRREQRAKDGDYGWSGVIVVGLMSFFLFWAIGYFIFFEQGHSGFPLAVIGGLIVAALQRKFFW